MRTLFAACLFTLPIITACAPEKPIPSVPKRSSFETRRALDNVELNYPHITLEFVSTGEKHSSDDDNVFPPPRTIDCSKLDREPDGYKDAIKAGALIVRIHTPSQVMQRIITQEGKEITKPIPIKPLYGGVLALCKVSKKAKGLDSRSYNIRDLDNYLVMGRGGKISVLGAELTYKKKTQADRIGDRIEDRVGDTIEDRIGDMLGGFSKMVSDNRDLFSDKSTHSADYSWMLWLTDRTTTFTNYEAELARSKAKKAKK